MANPFTDDRVELLVELVKERKTFSELKKLFKSPATLTSRLRELESLKLIDRILDKGSRSRIYYVITPKGLQLAKAYRDYSAQVKKLF